MCQYRSVRNLRESEFEALRYAALQITREWSSEKASMALRATGLERADGERETLDSIATDVGVSRETVRRARNQMLHAIKPPTGETNGAVYSSLSLHVPPEPSAEAPATARALRRLLTMTGPLQWDEVMSAWSRAGGKPPYSPLPEDAASMLAWAGKVGGFSVTTAETGMRTVTIAVDLSEELDQVSQFLHDVLSARPEGIARNELLDLAEGAGLKPATIATALSTHPAVQRVGRAMWALRGKRRDASSESDRITGPRRTGRARPTIFTWGADGSLLIEFSVPRGPSPVLAVPKAVSEVVEGRDFLVEQGAKLKHVTVRNARLWGFGPSLSDLGLSGGARATVALDLIANKAIIRPAEGKNTTS